jgi:hypothetical protein
MESCWLRVGEGSWHGDSGLLVMAMQREREGVLAVAGLGGREALCEKSQGE